MSEPATAGGEPEGQMPTQAIELASTPPDAQNSDAELLNGSGSSRNDNREEVPPLAFAIFVTRKPWIVCCGCWVIIIICLILAASGFDIANQASREFIVEDDQYVIRQDSITLAREEAINAANSDVVEKPNSVNSGLFTWVLYFRASKDTNFILTRSRLDTIMKFEGKITEGDYTKYCYAPGSPSGDYTCRGQVSLAYQLTNLANYSLMSDADIRNWVLARKGMWLSSFNKGFNETNQAWFYRSFIFMGQPVPGAIVNSSYREQKYQNQRTKSTEQQAEYNTYAVPLWQSITTSHQGKFMENGMQIVALSFAPLINEFGSLLLESSAFAFGSMTFVLLYMWFHLESFWMACSGMFQILMAFPISFTLYHYIYGIGYFGFLSYLIIFVLLGLGADDIFVLVDAFHQSEHIVKNPEDLEERMSYSYRRAAKAMFVTQVTTFFAFIATSASVLMPIEAFGFWAATLVAVNYLLVISFYVASMILWVKYIRKNERFGCCCGCCCPRDVCCPYGCFWDGCCCEKKTLPDAQNVPTTTGTDNTDAKPPAALVRQKSVEDVMNDYRPMERFFGETWVNFVNKYKFPLLGLFLVFYAIGGYGASQLEPQTEDEQFFPEDHYFNFLFFEWPNDFYQGENDAIRTVDFYWGISGVDRTGNDRFDTENYGKVTYDTSFDMSSVAAQNFLNYTCWQLRRSNLMFTGVPEADRVDCFLYPGERRPGFVDFLTGRNLSYPFVAANPANQKNEFGKLIFEYMIQPNVQTVSAPFIDVRNISGTYEIKYLFFDCKTNLPFFPNPTEVKNQLQAWEDLKAKISSDCVAQGATGVCNPNFLDRGGQFTRLATADAFVSSATTGIAIALPLAFVILILSTHNLVIAFMSIMDIGGVVMSELAIMAALGWQLGVAESVALIMMIGFSVDYVVHLGHAYVECPYPGRLERLKFSMLTMGISVVSGGITTFGAGIFLSFPIFIFFRKIGLLLMTTIVNSLVWAFLFYTSLLAWLGPEGSFGRVPLEKVFFCCPQYFEDHMEDGQKKQPVKSASFNEKEDENRGSPHI